MLNIPDRVKELLHTDSVKKNIRIHFPNGERSDICNDLIVRNSVKLTESICSQDTLKFGLCESPVFECETVGVENIKDATIEVYCEIFGDVNTEDAVFRADIQAFVYPIPLGKFVVAQCDRQADILHRKVVAYAEMALHNWEFSDVEVSKQKCLVNSALPYNFNTYCFLASNVKGYINPSLEKTEIPISSMSKHIGSIYPTKEFVFPSGSVVSLYAVGYVYSMYNLPEINIDELYQITLDKRDELQTKVRNFTKELMGGALPEDVEMMKGVCDYLEKICNVHIEVNDEYAGVIKSGYDGYIYPYANGSSSTSLFIPALISLTPGSIAAASLVSYEPYEGSSKFYYPGGVNTSNIKVYKITDGIPTNMHLSFNRTKQDNKYTADGVVNIDLQKMFSSYTELSGCFTEYRREDGLFYDVNIKQKFGLTPSETLYPSSSLYPSGAVGGIIDTCDYQNCDYEDHYTIPFGLVACTFKDSSNQDIRYELWLTGFDAESIPETYQVYDISNNEIIKSQNWNLADIEAFCNTIADNIEGVTYIPMQLIGRGLPYVEAGDTFTVKTKSNDSITTIVLNRTMQGEIALTDTYTSK